MGDVTLEPRVLYAVDVLANEASGKKPDGTLTPRESAAFCAMELQQSDGCDPCGDLITRFKELFCGNTRPSEPLTYWAGIKDSSGRAHTVVNPKLRETLMKADFEYGNSDGVTTPNEIAELRLDLGVVSCSANFTLQAGKIVSMGGDCTFSGNTKECKPLDDALRAISSELLTEVAQKTTESLSVYGETLRGVIPQRSSK